MQAVLVSNQYKINKIASIVLIIFIFCQKAIKPKVFKTTTVLVE